MHREVRRVKSRPSSDGVSSTWLMSRQFGAQGSRVGRQECTVDRRSFETFGRGEARGEVVAWFSRFARSEGACAASPPSNGTEAVSRGRGRRDERRGEDPREAPRRQDRHEYTRSAIPVAHQPVPRRATSTLSEGPCARPIGAGSLAVVDVRRSAPLPESDDGLSSLVLGIRHPINQGPPRPTPFGSAFESTSGRSSKRRPSTGAWDCPSAFPEPGAAVGGATVDQRGSIGDRRSLLVGGVHSHDPRRKKVKNRAPIHVP